MSKILKKITMFVISILLLPVSIYAACSGSSPLLTTASCSVADIQACITVASAGDIINVPAGSCDWATTLNLNKSVKLVGADPKKGTGTNIRQTAANGFINIADGLDDWRITGFTFLTDTSADPRGNFNVIVATAGSFSSVRTNWRIDNNKFTGYHFAIYLMGIFSSTDVSSVIDNNTFYGGGIQFIGPGDVAWSEATSLGSKHFLFIENNAFHSLGALQTVQHFIASNNAARVVVRYNQVYIDDTGTYKSSLGDLFDAHGNGHGSNIRGVRTYEIYKNEYIITQSPVPYLSEGVYLRGGTGVVWGNKFYSVMSRGGAIALYDTRAAETGDTSTSAVCPAACSSTARCTAVYYKVEVASDPFTIFTTNNGNGTIVTGASSGAVATINSMARSGGNFLYFISPPSVPFQNGEWLTVGGVQKIKTISVSSLVNGEGYPCCDQVGRGMNNNSEPAYFWDNVDEKGATATVYTSDPAYFVKDRDYIIAQKPGYTPYEHPHPLTKPQTPLLRKTN